MLRLFYKFSGSTDLLKFSEMELEDDVDLGTIIAIYCPCEIENPNPIKLFAEIAESDPIQVVIPASQRSRIDFDLNVPWEDQSGFGRSMPTLENQNIGECSHNIQNSFPRLEIHPEVLATREDVDEGSDNDDHSHHDPNDDFSDIDLDDIPEDIDDEGPVEGENANPYWAGNTGPGIIIRNNPGSFMTYVDPDAAVAREFPEYTNIVPAHLLDLA
ncbi:hypothetical protein J1N35_001643 [Gossypium stocksii]|uniref:Uncharacterized protein n=1 Tax=Gossypium stocksii TaxID=47602 RepID=A0A9D3WKA5_9ROSI|nr:hypothetical protein J1N35_001643 [Gossypium stocksii]